MRTFDFEKLKRNYFISNFISGMLGSALISIAVTSGVGLLSLMLVVFCNLIDSIWGWVPFLLMIIAFVATITAFMRKYLKRCCKDFQEICDDISQYGKCENIINYVGKLPKKKGTEFDVRFDSVFLYVKSKAKIVVKLTRTVSQIKVFTPDDKKVHVIGYAEFIPVIDYNITRRWNVAVTFSDGTALVIPVKSKRKGDLLADELAKAVGNSQPTSPDSNDQAPVSLNEKTIAEFDPQEQPKQNGDIAMPHIGSPLGFLRYEIEHKIIRSFFFDNPETFIGALIQSNNTIFEIYDDAFQKAGINNPYSSKDFCVKGVRFDPDGFFMRINLPKPEFFPLCYRIYLVCDLEFKNAEFYTIERG